MDGGCSMPEDVLFEILVWPPVVSLLRFKSVCKFWFALIESSTFITQHLHHHSGKGSLLAFYSQNYSNFRFFSGNKYEVYTDLDFEEQWHTTIGHRFDLEMVDSCNGIICLHKKSTGDIVLWNPALKQLRHVPKSSIYNRHHAIGSFQTCCIGFGYDAKTNDYKLVRIIGYYKMPDNQVEVYSLRSSFWKVIHKNDSLPFTSIHCVREVHATSRDGICFWAGRGDNKDQVNLLISFDLKDEIFQTMSLPDDQCPGDPYFMDFLNDKLVYIKAVNKNPFDLSTKYFELWVLHEFSVKESWNKTYKIGSFNGSDYPRIIAFSKDEDILVLVLNDHQLNLYNLVTQEIYPSNPEEHNSYLVQALHYNESLVSIKIS